MQIEVWKTLLRRVPSDQTDNLMLMTAQGTEINVQAVLLMEEDYIVLRGRLAGTNEAGRIFVVPYAHLDHVGFQRPLSDVQFQAIFEDTPLESPLPPAPEAVAALPPPPTPAPAEPVAPSPAATGTADRDLLTRVPTRSEMIRRLRERSGAKEGGDSKAKR